MSFTAPSVLKVLIAYDSAHNSNRIKTDFNGKQNPLSRPDKGRHGCARRAHQAAAKPGRRRQKALSGNAEFRVVLVIVQAIFQ
jgi:hypothetical protein